MATCPNKNLQSWKQLVDARGESVAYYLWDKFEGTVPQQEYTAKTEPGRSAPDLSGLIKKAERAFGFNRSQPVASASQAFAIATQINTTPLYSGLYASVKPVMVNDKLQYQVELGSRTQVTEKLIQQVNNPAETRHITEMMNTLTSRFEGMSWQWIKPQDLKQQEHEVNVSRINSFVRGGVVYLVEGRATAQMGIEELLHPFVEGLSRSNRSVFLGLVLEAEKSFPELVKSIRAHKGYTTKADQDKEIVTRALTKAFDLKLDSQPESSYGQLRHLVNRFLQWLGDLLQNVFGVNKADYTVRPYSLPENLTLADLGKILSNEKAQIQTTLIDRPTYNLSEIEEDEKYFSARDRNIARIEEQMEGIKRLQAEAMDRDETAKVEVLEKILENMEQSIEDLLSGKNTVSVSKLVGGGNLDVIIDNQKFQNFGNFLHGALEELQRRHLEQGSSRFPSSMVDMSFIEEMLQREQTRKDPDAMFTSESGLPSDITDLQKKQIVEMVRDIVKNYDFYILNGYTVIPELTVTGKDKMGRTVIGRIDTLAISKDGKVEIIDLKTKKMNTDPDVSQINHQLSRKHLVESSADSAGEFFVLPEDSHRSAYENWDIQLGVYEAIFKQMEVEVDRKRVVVLVYMGESAQINLPGSLSTAYDFRFTDHAVFTHDSALESYGNLGDRLRYTKFQEVVKKVMNLEQQKKQENKDALRSIFNLNEQQEKELLKRINDVLDGEIEKTRKAKQKYKREAGEESEIYKSLNEREESLKKVRDIMTKSNQNWDVAYKLSLALNYLDQSYETMLKAVDEIKAVENIEDRAQMLDALRRRANGLNYFIDELERSLIGIDPLKNKAAIEVIGRIKTNMQAVMIAYNELGADFMIKVVQSMDGKQRQNRLSKEREQAIRPRLEYLKKQLDNLNKGNTGVMQKLSGIKFWALGNLKNAVGSIFNVPVEEVNQRKHIELQIKQLELELEGVKLDDKSIRNYVEGVLENEQSLLYMGNKVTVISNIIASASSSDLGVSGFTNFLKNVQQDAQRTYVNFMEKAKFQQQLDKFAKGEKDMTKLSKRLTEVRTKMEVQEDGSMKPVQYLSFIDPVSEEYRNVFRDYRENLFKLNQQIREADKQGKEQERKDLIKQKSRLVEQHRQWKMENSLMPLVKEVYELENLLPAEYREKRAEILEELDAIRHKVGYNNEELMSEEDSERIAELEVDLQRLKTDFLKDKIEYKEYIEKLEQYYAYEPNLNFFNRMKNSKMIQYGEDSVEYKKWLAENTVTVPNQDYYEEIADIFDQMFEIMQSNEEIQELRKQQREILAGVKRRGYADVRYLTDAERKEYEELDELIQQIFENSERPEYDSTERDILRRLRNQLSGLRTKGYNPYYEKAYISMKQALDQKFDFYQQQKQLLSESPGDAQLERNVQLAYNNFLTEEEEFEKWYNDNHVDEYESRLLADKPLNPQPKRFNLVDIPTNPKHFDVKPSNKYTLRKLREKADGTGKVAANPEYQEDVYGFPLPKGMTKTNGLATVVTPGKYVNPAYVALSRNTDDFAFYQFLVGDFLERQKKTYGKNLGYYVPGYDETSLRIFQEKGVIEGGKENFEIWKKKNFSVNTPYGYDFNEFIDNDTERIRFHHNKPLPLEEQTQNAIGAVIKWHEEAIINSSIARVQPLANAAISYLEGISKQLDNANVPDLQKRKQELATVINVLRSEYGKIVKGETKMDQGGLARFFDTTLRGLSLTRMGLDIPNQLGNLFSGNVQIFLGGHKTGQYNNKNLLWAKGKIYGRSGLMGSLIKDFDKISGKTFMTKMYMYFNPLQEMMAELTDKSLSRADRTKQSLMDLEFSMWLQDKGEIEIASTIWLAMMDNRMVKYVDPQTQEEKMVNVWEAYGESADGEIIIKPGYDWTKNDEAELLRNVYSEIRRTQGNYAGIDKTRAEQNILGRMGMFFRKYLVPAVQNRFGSMREDHEGSQVAMGYYNALWKSLKYFGVKKTLMSLFQKDAIDPFYRQRVFWAAREMVVTLFMYLMGAMLKNIYQGIKDDDDEDGLTVGDVVMMNMLAVFLKVDRETRSLVPIPIFGGIDNYATELSSFTNAGTDFKVLVKLLGHGTLLMVDQFPGVESEWLDKNAYYQRRYGMFEKGEAKFNKDLLDVTGVMNIYNMFDPETRLTEGFKRR